MAVKNSEYKAVDDTQVKGQEIVTSRLGPLAQYAYNYVDDRTVEQNREDSLEVDTQGFSFHTLKSEIITHFVSERYILCVFM